MIMMMMVMMIENVRVKKKWQFTLTHAVLLPQNVKENNWIKHSGCVSN